MTVQSLQNAGGPDQGAELRAEHPVSRRGTLRAGLAGAAVLAGSGALWRTLGTSASPRRAPGAANIHSRRQRYAAALARGAHHNPIGRHVGVDGYGPVAAARLTALGPAGSPGYVTYPASENASLFKLFGGTRHLRYDDWQALSVSYADGHLAQNTGRVAFLTDADELDLLVATSESASYRVIVDGLYVSREGIGTRSLRGIRDYLHLAQSPLPAGALRLRRIDVEMFSPEGAFGGVALPKEATIAPVPIDAVYRIACFGDSLSNGTGCRNQNDAWNVVAGYVLGGVDIDMVQMALGGTGFINDGPSWRAIDHISDLERQAYDELWIAMGINDRARSAEITSAALAFFRAARRLLPNRPIIVFGIARNDSDGAVRLERALSRAFDLWQDRRSAWIPFQTGRQKLFTGSVDGKGNFAAARYGGGVDGRDDTHPSVAGHRYMAGVVAAARQEVFLP